MAVSHFGGRKIFNHKSYFMKMNRKGFANIILVVVTVVFLAGAVGYFALTKKSEPVAQPPAPTPTQTKAPSPTPTLTDETANWKTYTNGELEFTTKYPNNWTVEIDPATYLGGDIVLFRPQNPKPITSYLDIYLDTRKFKDINEIKEFYSRLDKDPLASYKHPVQEMTIGNQKAYAFLRSDLPNYRVIYLFRNGKIYNFISGEYNLPEISKILSTFRFTN